MILALSIINTVLNSIILFIAGAIFFKSFDKKSHMIITGFVMFTQLLSIITNWSLYGMIF